MGNMVNIMTSGDSRFTAYLNKLIYITPVNTIHNFQVSDHYYLIKGNRDISILTTFGGKPHSNSRRNDFVNRMQNTKYSHILNKNSAYY